MYVSSTRNRPFNSRPHEEVDPLYLHRKVIDSLPFNSRPHEEVDERRATADLLIRAFNSRPHEEVDSAHLFRLRSYMPFNSRPHEEVDRETGEGKEEHESFNSRPHEEVDSNHSALRNLRRLSTHDLTRRSTSTTLMQTGSPLFFQLTTSRGGRRWVTDLEDFLMSLSTHDLTRRSTPEESDDACGRRLSTHDLTRRSTLQIKMLSR